MGTGHTFCNCILVMPHAFMKPDNVGRATCRNMKLVGPHPQINVSLRPSDYINDLSLLTVILNHYYLR